MSGCFGTVSCAGLILLCAATVAPAAAQSALQLDDFTWTFSGDPSGSGTVGTDTLHLVGPAWDQCTTFDLFAWFTTTATASGTVSAHYLFDNQDGGFGWWVVEDAVFIVNGSKTFVGPLDPFWNPWEEDVSFHVEAGDSFGFGTWTSDCSFGPGVLDVSAFSFVADTWKDLGQGLAGIYGVPPLVGLGTLEAGAPYTLSVVDALELAPAWLVVGVAPLGLPFKGGVLVPDPAPPAALLLFNTGPNGRVVLNGSWPAGLPAGTTLYLQYWFGDPAGPAGFSASNALSATTP